MESSLVCLGLGDGLVGRLDVTETLCRVCLGVWVEAEKDLLVLERVLLLDDGALGNGTTLDRAEHALDFAAVDELANVGLRNNVGWEEEVALELGWSSGAAVDGVQSGKCGRGPDDETAEVTTWCKLEEVECVDWAGLDTGNIAESLDEVLAILLWLVDDERSTTLGVAAVPQLTLTSTELAGSLDLGELWASTNSLEESDSGGGLLDSDTSECGRGDDERDLGDVGDAVTTGEEEGGAGRCSDGRGSCETLLAKVDLLVPLAPDLGWCEHATRAAHVTKGSLTGTVSTTTRDTWDTGNSTTWRYDVSMCQIHPPCHRLALMPFLPSSSSFPISDWCFVRTSSPRLSTGLVTGLLAHGIWLALVLGHTGVDSSVSSPSAPTLTIASNGFSVYRTGQCPGG